MTRTDAGTVNLLWLWTAIGLGAFAPPFLGYYLPGEGILDINKNIIGNDFVNVWFGGKLAWQRRLEILYSAPQYFAEMLKQFDQSFLPHNFSYLPNILPLILIFGLLPYFPSLALWTLGGAAALFTALRGRVPRLMPAFLAVIASPAASFNFISGQNGAYTAALFTGGLFLCESYPIVAGMLFGLLTVKPHLGILIPVVLILRRNWKCIASAAVTAVALAAASLAAWGLAPWQGSFNNTLPFQAAFIDSHVLTVPNMLMPGLYADLTTVLGMDGIAAHALWACGALYAAFISLRAVAKEGITPRSILMLAIATLLILPYGFNYDMVGISVAIAIYFSGAKDMPKSGFLLLGLLWALPGALMIIKCIPLPLCSFTMLAALTWLAFSPAAGKSRTRSGDSCSHPSTGAGPAAAER